MVNSIERLTVDLRCHTGTSQIETLVTDEILPALEALLEKIDVVGKLTIIPSLEIDVGQVAALDMLSASVIDGLENALRRSIESSMPSSMKGTTEMESAGEMALRAEDLDISSHRRKETANNPNGINKNAKYISPVSPEHYEQDSEGRDREAREENRQYTQESVTALNDLDSGISPELDVSLVQTHTADASVPKDEGGNEATRESTQPRHSLPNTQVLQIVSPDKSGEGEKDWRVGGNVTPAQLLGGYVSTGAFVNAQSHLAESVRDCWSSLVSDAPSLDEFVGHYLLRNPQQWLRLTAVIPSATIRERYLGPWKSVVDTLMPSDFGGLSLSSGALQQLNQSGGRDWLQVVIGYCLRQGFGSPQKALDTLSIDERAGRSSEPYDESIQSYVRAREADPGLPRQVSLVLVQRILDIWLSGIPGGSISESFSDRADELHASPSGTNAEKREVPAASDLAEAQSTEQSRESKRIKTQGKYNEEGSEGTEDEVSRRENLSDSSGESVKQTSTKVCATEASHQKAAGVRDAILDESENLRSFFEKISALPNKDADTKPNTPTWFSDNTQVTSTISDNSALNPGSPASSEASVASSVSVSEHLADALLSLADDMGVTLPSDNVDDNTPHEMPTAFTVSNAGLVILAPFFNRLFTDAGLKTKDGFIDGQARHRAVLLTQYLALGDFAIDHYIEPALVLNKVLCGIAPAQALNLSEGLSDAEKSCADSLILGVIEQWSALKNTGPESFRNTFIRRAGLLRESDQSFQLGWQLTVEGKPFDVLMDRLPWSVSLHRYSWMQAPVFVAW
ncbi:Uncharacterised protein [BD1-7 clade bacterium]|uniref:Uncharacterized protein n=1 Tax=BD1-7 clade bacterium TaxID=2029982 RepID=A0A5S9QSE7_9GAMM|nr:Uncharacterised protein [BD1-7 clade bacterium]CAA0121142.1 Uncharacterised protein [BD1-7 clade bacterium]